MTLKEEKESVKVKKRSSKHRVGRSAKKKVDVRGGGDLLRKEER